MQRDVMVLMQARRKGGPWERGLHVTGPRRRLGNGITKFCVFVFVVLFFVFCFCSGPEETGKKNNF